MVASITVAEEWLDQMTQITIGSECPLYRQGDEKQSRRFDAERTRQIWKEEEGV